MKISPKIVASLIALTALMPLALSSNMAQAQQYNTSQNTVRIEGFNVDEVRRIVPGAELNFDIYGTPGGLATLRIAGATRNLTLVEGEPGQYEGTYTISERDRIEARSAVTANLRVGNQVASIVLNESLQIGVGYHSDKPLVGPQPRIDRFDVEPVAELSGGNDLQFTLSGTPGAKADVVIKGVKGKIILEEVKNGEYVGAYTIKNRDRIKHNSAVTARLTLGERVSSVNLDKNLQTATDLTPARASSYCNNCGKVEAVNRVEVKGEGSYLGIIGGGVVGALLGSQIGDGKGRTAAEIAGALGGAYAGHTIEGKVRKTYHYEVLVRMQNGSTQTFTFKVEPGYRVGDEVKINEGVLAHNN